MEIAVRERRAIGTGTSLISSGHDEISDGRGAPSVASDEACSIDCARVPGHPDAWATGRSTCMREPGQPPAAATGAATFALFASTAASS